MDDETILKKLEEVIRLGDGLVKKLSSCTSEYCLNYNGSYYQAAMKWWGAADNLLELRFGKQSEYHQNFIVVTKPQYHGKGQFYSENVQLGNGVLEYVYDALKNGLTGDLFYQQEIIVFSNLLEQAFEFLDKKLRLAAAIYGRIVLETTIREYAVKKDVENSKLKFNDLIIEMTRQKIILKPFEESLRANYSIGNWAAHGDEKFQKLSDNQIKEFLTFIQDKVLTM